MDVCPSCGEPLELIEEAGLRSGFTEEGAVAPGGAEPANPPKAKMVCSVCSWPVRDDRP